MQWLTLMTLTDGSQVQSRMPALPDPDTDRRDYRIHPDYRIRHRDGSSVEFTAMLDVTRYLHARYGIDEGQAHDRGTRPRSGHR